MNSRPYVFELGYVACIVTSKYLGIGQAERCWGDVKDIKSLKRGALSSTSIEQQAVIYGKSCIERSCAELKSADLSKYMEEKDFMQQVNEWLENNDDSSCDSNEDIRDFKAWQEEWEVPLIKKQDQRNEAKLLSKYSGVHYHVVDDTTTYQIINQLKWYKKKGSRGYYCVMGIPADKQPNEETAVDEYDMFEFSDDLYECITKAQQPPSLQLRVIEAKEEESDDECNEDSI